MEDETLEINCEENVLEKEYAAQVKLVNKDEVMFKPMRKRKWGKIAGATLIGTFLVCFWIQQITFWGGISILIAGILLTIYFLNKNSKEEPFPFNEPIILQGNDLKKGQTVEIKVQIQRQ